MIKKIIALLIILFLGMFLLGCMGEDILPTTTTTTCVDTTTTTETTTTTTESTTTTTTSSTTTTIASGTITGTIDLDGQSDDSGATVKIDGTSLLATTASDGSFTISNVPVSTYSLTITKDGFVTGNISNIVVTAGSASNASTIILYKMATIESVYDMSALSGTVLNMTYFDGFLIISTDSPKLYKISTANLSTAGSVTPTKNLDPLFVLPAGIFGASSMLLGSFETPDHHLSCSIYNLVLEKQGDDTTPSIEPYETCAVTMYDHTSPTINHLVFYFKSTTSFTIYTLADHIAIVPSYTSNETGINSMQNNSAYTYFYACNSTFIYKYNPTFVLQGKRSLGTSNLAGIAYDGTYIWAIDATTKMLYKIADSL